MQKNVKKTELNQTAWWKRALCCVQDNVRGQNILVIVPGARRKKTEQNYVSLACSELNLQQ